MKFYGVKNFEKFQLAKTGKNATQTLWIRLYYSLLTDYGFSRLPDATKFHFIGLCLLAGQTKNQIPADHHWISQRIGNTSDIDFSALISGGFLYVCDSHRTVLGQSEDCPTQILPRGEERRREEKIAASGDAVVSPRSRVRKNTAGPSSAHRHLTDRFVAAWHDRFGRNYAFQNAKDGAAVGRILKAVGGDVEQAMRLVSAFLADSDPFIAKSGYTLSFFGSQINRYLAGAHAASPTKARDGEPNFDRVVDEDVMAIALGDGGES